MAHRERALSGKERGHEKWDLINFFLFGFLDEKLMEDEVGLGRVLEAIHSYEYEAESKDGSKR